MTAKKPTQKSGFSRRDFIKTSTAAGTVVALAPYEKAFAQLHNVGAFWRRRPGVGLYSLSQSLRFNKANSTRLVGPSFSGASLTKMTFSFWMKRSNFGTTTDQVIHATNGTVYSLIAFNWSDDSMRVYQWDGAAFDFQKVTSMQFRDPGAWYHIVVSYDTANAIAEDRIKIFVNGVRITSFSSNTNPSVSLPLYLLGSGYTHRMGCSVTTANFWDLYLSEFYCIQGQAYDPTVFGQFSSITGQWEPKQYSGSFGANGFYLPFKNNSAVDGSGTASGAYPNVTGVSGLGADFSGNNLHWTGPGFTINDQVLDSPTNNFCTLNTLKAMSNPSAGGLSLPTVAQNVIHPTYAHRSGKWYAEFTTSAASSSTACGVTVRPESAPATTITDVNAANTTYYRNDGTLLENGSGVASYSAWSGAAHTIGVALDMDSGTRTAKWYYDGVLQGTRNLVDQTSDYVITTYQYGSGVTIFANYGQGGQSGLAYDAASGGRFKYAPPAGYKAVCTKNLPTPAVSYAKKYFRTLTYTGNGDSQYVGEYLQRASTYSVGQSLRGTAASSTSLTRTPTVTGDRQKWTLSLWLKKTKNGTDQGIIHAYNGTAWTDQSFRFDTSDQLRFTYYPGTSTPVYGFTTTQTFKDTSTWFHVCLATDTTQATAADRQKVYINGTLVATTSLANGYLPINMSMSYNLSGLATSLLAHTSAGANAFDGYAAEINFIDGQVLSATSFGQSDSASGEWVPKSYSGTYGTNGFYLNFSDNSNTTSATLGKDTSGNNNDWTPNNFVVNNQVLDSPTKNWCTLNPSATNANGTYSNGNLTAYSGTAQGHYTPGTLPMKTGKFYWEVKLDSIVSGTYPNSAQGIGISDSDAYTNHNEYIYHGYTGNKINNANNIAYGATYTTGAVIGVAVDLDAGKVWYAKNNVWQASGDPATGANPAFQFYKNIPFVPLIQDRSSTDGVQMTMNFGQGGQTGLTFDAASGGRFLYTPPAGFKVLNQANIAVSATNALAPDLVWLKSRSAATDHALYDSVRGAGADLASNLSSAESSQVNGLVQLTKGGFQVGNLAKLNTASATYAAWGWKAGTSAQAGNESVSAASGFSIVKFTGDGTGSRLINHNLVVAPAFVVIKSRNNTGTTGWNVWHQKLAGASYYLDLSTTAAQSNAASNFTGTWSPTQFGIASTFNTTSALNIAYLFAEVPGFSKFGSYTGNGAADGPFVWCGFRPAFVIFKRIDAAGYGWNIYDSTRDPDNISSLYVNAEATQVETTYATVDLLSNGFKLRLTVSPNVSGGNYIFIAFAEAPFKYANAR